ncbi:MAG: MBL fold metallo-hydrolase [Bacteroides sp.]|jgi:glyoxylase-like metal-dependent hydrolase (beta-lactamase superfamily II)|nr:MBL fold metallo-hydrolase [Bacteroides sp.]MCI1681810.1 MBL fold metallo-hydrolase [Bacteroides sp.]
MKKVVMFFLFCEIALVPFAQEVYKNDELTISKLADKTWVVETSDNTTMYILEGEKRAMLIDTGTKCAALDKIVRKITAKPLYVVVTHNHVDHAGNIRYFKEVYMHPADSIVRVTIPFNGKYIWLRDGQIFDLGNRKIEVKWMPGHTPGSIVLLDRNIHACYSGDAFGSGQVWLQLRPHVPMKTYYESCVHMEKIMEKEEITSIYCGHYPYLHRALGLQYIIDMKNLAKCISDGDNIDVKPYPYSNNVDISSKKSVFAKSGSAMIVYDSEHIN